ncbi:MAG: hypothetical protein KDC50_01255 [Flavobacterium sp.]|uniref:hypothetical protein n=1 Tax=Flavobacterium sp. TaxID=239 RepID=UPI001E087714|nr:hypothetical protein [Flavobacterium sp.]
MKKIFLLFLLITSFQLFSQSLNDYKYVLVPLKFSDFDSENQYRLNTITKLNLEKMGFIAFYENTEIPREVSNDRCAILSVDVRKGKQLFWTKVTIVFKDCFGKVVYESPDGRTKEKEYKKAYPEALQEAFKAFSAFNYKFNDTKVVAVSNNPSQEPAIENVATSGYETKDFSNLLFAQPTANGFQLVDSTPKVVYKLFKTDNPSLFLAQKGNQNGVITMKDGSWFFEYQENEKVISEKLEIKF